MHRQPRFKMVLELKGLQRRCKAALGLRLQRRFLALGLVTVIGLLITLSLAWCFVHSKRGMSPPQRDATYSKSRKQYVTLSSKTEDHAVSNDYGVSPAIMYVS